MTTIMAIALLAILQQSSAAAKPLTGQPCTGPDIIGTWQLVESGGKAIPAGDSAAIKHVTPTHFFVVSVDAQGLASYGHGGPYSLSAGTYTESVTQGFGGPFTQVLRGMKFSFQCRVEAGTWQTVGDVNGQTFDERWKRVQTDGAP